MILTIVSSSTLSVPIDKPNNIEQQDTAKTTDLIIGTPNDPSSSVVTTTDEGKQPAEAVSLDANPTKTIEGASDLETANTFWGGYSGWGGYYRRPSYYGWRRGYGDYGYGGGWGWRGRGLYGGGWGWGSPSYWYY